MLNDNDLIRRGDLKDLLLKRSFFPAIVAAALKEIPAVDAVEVVRCKECKYWWKQNELCAHPKCRTGMVCVTEAPPNHYCGYGERKDDGY